MKNTLWHVLRLKIVFDSIENRFALVIALREIELVLVDASILSPFEGQEIEEPDIRVESKGKGRKVLNTQGSLRQSIVIISVQRGREKNENIVRPYCCLGRKSTRSDCRREVR